MLWLVAVAGFLVLVGLMLFSLSLPAMMIGQSNEDLWMREFALVGALFLNQFATVGYFSLVSWLEEAP